MGHATGAGTAAPAAAGATTAWTKYRRSVQQLQSMLVVRTAAARVRACKQTEETGHEIAAKITTGTMMGAAAAVEDTDIVTTSGGARSHAAQVR